MMWFCDQYDLGPGLENVSAAWRFCGELDLVVLQQSLNEMVRRHEVLRTTFAAENGSPIQIIAEPGPLPLPLTDLSSAPEPEAQAQAILEKEAARPFDLAQGPLIRACLIKLAEDEHILMLGMHHVVADGWSLDVLLSELCVLYGAFRRGQDSPLAALPIQYADFATWQRERLQGEVLDAHLGFWKRYLEGALTALELPTNHLRPHRLTQPVGRVDFELSAELCARLRKLSQGSQVTPLITIAAVLNVLLYRYSYQDDICIGYPVGHNRYETEGLIGPFVNTLVLRTHLTPEQTFETLLEQVRESVLNADEYRDLPFDQLVEELRPERDSSRHPLFQVLFTYDSLTQADLRQPGLKISPVQTKSWPAKFDLSLSISETPEALRGGFEYATDMFDREMIERLIGHFQTVLEGAVGHPQARISELPLLTEAESHQLLVEWNDTAMAYPRDKTIHQLFEEQVARTPNAVALIYGGERLTYGELNTRANQLAHYLCGRGVTRGSLVGVCLERSAEMVTVLLGVLKAGGAYVPLDPTYPAERLSFMLADSGAGAMVTQERLLGRLPGDVAEVVCVDRDWDEIALQARHNPESRVSAEDFCFVIYTSGSTGVPKGVGSMHRSSVVMFSWMWAAYPFKDGEVYCQRTTLNFIVSVWELFLPLLQGVSVVVVPDSIVKDPNQLIAYLAARQVTRILLVPSLLRTILDAVVDLSHRAPKLKHWVLAGEPLPVELAIRFEQCVPGAELLNLYGSSETHSATSFLVRGVQEMTRVPIGRQFANRRVYILDEQLQPVPIGVPGEIYIAGDGVSRGYVNREELTRQRFIPDPFSSEDGAIFYRTGDRARYLPDGNIEMVGRVDNQVQLRGFRVELGEVETALSKHPGVKQCVVVAREDEEGEKRLVAYVVANPDRPTVMQLREHVRQRLPEYMAPSAFTFLEKIPTTPNGKVDRLALPEPDQCRPELQEGYTAPHNSTQAAIVDIWANVLNLGQVGIHDAFFDLGGYSNKAAQIMVQIRDRFGVELPLRVFFESLTVEKLSARVETALWLSQRPTHTSSATERVSGEIL